MVGFLDRFVYSEKHEDSIVSALDLSSEELDGIKRMEDNEEREKEWLRLLMNKLGEILTGRD
jgi:hypothetical protein